MQHALLTFRLTLSHKLWMVQAARFTSTLDMLRPQIQTRSKNQPPGVFRRISRVERFLDLDLTQITSRSHPSLRPVDAIVYGNYGLGHTEIHCLLHDKTIPRRPKIHQNWELCRPFEGNEVFNEPAENGEVSNLNGKAEKAPDSSLSRCNLRESVKIVLTLNTIKSLLCVKELPSSLQSTASAGALLSSEH